MFCLSRLMTIYLDCLHSRVFEETTTNLSDTFPTFIDNQLQASNTIIQKEHYCTHSKASSRSSKNKIANVPSPSKPSKPEVLDTFISSVPIRELKFKISKKTATNRPKDPKKCCNFSIVIFCDCPNENWFIAQRPMKSTATASCVHNYHLPINPKDINTTTHNMPIGIEKGLQEMLNTGATNSTIISFFHKNHDINLSPSLISNHRNKLFNNWVQKLTLENEKYIKSSSIDRMISLMRSISNLSFVYMTHSKESSLICHNKNDKLSYKLLSTNIEMDIIKWRTELLITDKEDVLISFAWCHDDEK